MPDRLSLAEAHDALYAELEDNVDGVDAYYDFEPAPGGINGSRALTVSFAGMDATTWTFAIRLYVNPAAGSAKEADDDIISIVPLIETAVDSRWGPVNFVKEWVPDIERWVVTWLAMCGREDI